MKFIVFPLRKKKLIGGVLRSTGSRILYIIKPDLRKYKYIDGSGTLGGVALFWLKPRQIISTEVYMHSRLGKKRKEKSWTETRSHFTHNYMESISFLSMHKQFIYLFFSLWTKHIFPIFSLLLPSLPTAKFMIVVFVVWKKQV